MTTEETQDRIDRFTRTLVKRYGLTDEALRVAVGKFVEQAELREKYEKELMHQLGIKENEG